MWVGQNEQKFHFSLIYYHKINQFDVIKQSIYENMHNSFIIHMCGATQTTTVTKKKTSHEKHV
jgi:hypothetical protein